MSGEWEWTPADMTDVPFLASAVPMPPTLTDFLLARIAEDEEVARYAATRTRSLAECEAKRRIVGMYVGPTEDDEGNLSAIGGYGEAWVDAIRFLALPYADHPDYRQEWKP